MKLYNIVKHKSGAQTIVVVLLYIMLLSLLISSLIYFTLSSAQNDLNTRNHDIALKLAQSKVNQILGADDDLFDTNSAEASISFARLKSVTSTETLETNKLNSKSDDGIETLGEISFLHAGDNSDSTVKCTRTSQNFLDSIFLPQFKSLDVKIANTSSINVAFKSADSILFSVIFDSTTGSKSVEFGVSKSQNANSAGTLALINGQAFYPTAIPDGLNLSSFIFQSSDTDSSFDAVKVDIPGLISNIANSKILATGTTLSKVDSITITPMSDSLENSEIKLSGSLPSNFVKLSCEAEVGESTANLATATVETIYPSSLITPNFLDYSLAVGKYKDATGDENYQLTK